MFKYKSFCLLERPYMTDKELIEKLGGATTLAKRIKYSVQRVQNWKIRGIPAKVKLEHADIFMQSSSVDENHKVSTR